MSSMSELMNTIYQGQGHSQGLQKTAEAVFENNLRGSSLDGRLESLSDAELVKLANQAGFDISRTEGIGGQPDEIDNFIEDRASRVAAHATVHELQMAKIAMAQGKCRMCKSNKLRRDGYSVCPKCRG